MYIQSISNKSLSDQTLQKLKYIANFEHYQTHIEGEFELETSSENISTLNFILEVDLGENPLVRYLAYLYYKPKMENETTASLERLKRLCENPVFCRK